jgi:hypothetical protein
VEWYKVSHFHLQIKVLNSKMVTDFSFKVLLPSASTFLYFCIAGFHG